MHTELWHLHCEQWLKNQTQACQKPPNLFWMDTKPVLPELKTIAKYSAAKIAIPDSSSDTLLSLYIHPSHRAQRKFTYGSRQHNLAAQGTSNSAILNNNYVSLLSDRLSAHAYKHENGVTNEAIVIEWAAAAAW